MTDRITGLTDGESRSALEQCFSRLATRFYARTHGLPEPRADVVRRYPKTEDFPLDDWISTVDLAHAVGMVVCTVDGRLRRAEINGLVRRRRVGQVNQWRRK